MKVENLESLIKKFRAKLVQYMSSPNAVQGESVIVGYTANYAVYVHENLEAAHGQAYNIKYAAKIAEGLAKKGKAVKTDLFGQLAAGKISNAEYQRRLSRIKNFKRGVKAQWKYRGAGQQAKFLEQPARELSNNGQLAAIVRNQLAAGVKMQPALMTAGQAILAAADQIVPVDTGNLRASGFVAAE